MTADTVASGGTGSVLCRLRSRSGLRVRTGPFCLRISTPLSDVGRAVAELYADYESPGDDEFIDFDVAVRRPAGWRGWTASQVEFRFEGEVPFNPLPGDQGLPLLEWGLNWCVYSMCHQYLVVHAAVLERDGRAVVLPGPSGSGKSTLCAALAFSGWRLLSDELALFDPVDGQLIPNPRPVSLKNASIDVIRQFAPHARLGSLVRDTAKGVVAHFCAPIDAVRASGVRARPRWIVLPRFVPGAPTELARLDRASAFMKLVENAFNYDIHGRRGFDAFAGVMDGCRPFTFTYSDIRSAVDAFDRLAREDRGLDG